MFTVEFGDPSFTTCATDTAFFFAFFFFEIGLFLTGG